MKLAWYFQERHFSLYVLARNKMANTGSQPSHSFNSLQFSMPHVNYAELGYSPKSTRRRSPSTQRNAILYDDVEVILIHIKWPEQSDKRTIQFRCKQFRKTKCLSMRKSILRSSHLFISLERRCGFSVNAPTSATEWTNNQYPVYTQRSARQHRNSPNIN